MGWIEEYRNNNQINRTSLNDFKAKQIESSGLEFIYKYQPFDLNRLISIENNTLWLSKGEILNDPFECNPTYIETDFITEYLKSETNFSYSDENELSETSQILSERIKTMLKELGISCFSETNSHFVLWGNYAENNTGICLEYPLKEVLNTTFRDKTYFNYFFKVDYSTKRTDMRFLYKQLLTNSKLRASNAETELYLQVISKHHFWSYEKEWRIVVPNHLTPVTQKGFSVPFIKPSAIYLGINFNNNYISFVKKFCEEHQIQLYKMNIKDFDEHKLAPERI